MILFNSIQHRLSLSTESYDDNYKSHNCDSFLPIPSSPSSLLSQRRFSSSSRRKDPAVQSAVEVLKKHFTNARGKPIKTPFFKRQLQIFYEADFFPWVINDALNILEHEGYLLSIDSSQIPGFRQLKNVRQMKFYANAKAESTIAELQRTMIKKALSIGKVVNAYSHPQITSHVGRHLEDLLGYELRAQGFRIIGSHTNEYRGKKWTNSNFNLDHIAEHKSGRLAIGLEAKNTLGIISQKEIDEKISVCRHLGLTPVFAARWIKPYIRHISKEGGFCWVFKTQIYPLGYDALTREAYRRLSVSERQDSRGHRLEFPVTATNMLPNLSLRNFERWVERRVNGDKTDLSATKSS